MAKIKKTPVKKKSLKNPSKKSKSEKQSEVLAFVKYEGKLVKGGYMDAFKSAEALLGFDEVVRYFLYQEVPQLQQSKFELPVKINEGSWEIDLSQHIGTIVSLAVGGGLAAYFASAGTEMAKKDFKDKGVKEVFIAAFNKIKWVIRIANHLGKLGVKKFKETKFRKNNTEIGIPDEKGVLLWVRMEYLTAYQNCPEKLFSRFTRIVELERKFRIGVNKDLIEDKFDKFDSTITFREKYIYTVNEDTIEEVIFPEFEHKKFVTLKGHVTRGNEKTNTLGFEYQGHVLFCYPASGTILAHKHLMFTDCIITGYIDRYNVDGNFIENRPKIIFTELQSDNKGQKSLFEE
jgi:hypothetical protein